MLKDREVSMLDTNSLKSRMSDVLANCQPASAMRRNPLSETEKNLLLNSDIRLDNELIKNILNHNMRKKSSHLLDSSDVAPEQYAPDITEKGAYPALWELQEFLFDEENAAIWQTLMINIMGVCALSVIAGLCVGLSEPVSRLPFSWIFIPTLIIEAIKIFAVCLVYGCQPAQERLVEPLDIFLGWFGYVVLGCGVVGLLLLIQPSAAVCCLSISSVSSLFLLPFVCFHFPLKIPASGWSLLLYHVAAAFVLYFAAEYAVNHLI